MNIVIIGDGKVGFKLAKNLSSDEHDVTLIDPDEEKLREAGNILDIQCVPGDGVSAEIQKSAGVSSADLTIACTSSDELNMIACMIAKKLGTKNTIARIRNPIYYNEMSLIKEELKLTMFVNPEKETARAISRLIMYPDAGHVTNFAKGKIEILDHKVSSDSALVGLTLRQMSSIYCGTKLVVAVEKGEDVFIPGGNYEIAAGDVLHFAFDRADVDKFFEQVGRKRSALKKIIICGGGRVTYYLAVELIRSGKDVKIIEKDLEKCKDLADKLPGATIIHGDATNHDLLREENISCADVFIGLTGMDEENMIAGLFAQQCGVKKVIIKVNEDQRAKMMYNLGIDSVLSPKTLTANVIMSYVTARNRSHASESIEAVYNLVDGKVRALEFVINEDSKYTNKPIKDLNVKQGTLITCIIRKTKPIIPDGNTQIHKGDTVIIVTNKPKVSSIEELL